MIVLLISFVLSGLHYFHMWKRTTHYGHLRVEVDQLQKENETFRLTAKQLNEKVSLLEVTTKKLHIFSGLDQEGLGGVGGPMDWGNIGLGLNNRALYKHFLSLDRRTISLVSELRQLHEYYANRHRLLTATPSLMPVRGYPSANFGYRLDPFSGDREFHPGIDISAPRGKKVMASTDGLVVFAGRHRGYGKLVTLGHPFRISTRYGHLGRVAVKVGQKVKKGDILGYVGSTGRATGPHLHYEVRFNDRPLNPLRFFQKLD